VKGRGDGPSLPRRRNVSLERVGVRRVVVAEEAPVPGWILRLRFAPRRMTARRFAARRMTAWRFAARRMTAWRFA